MVKEIERKFLIDVRKLPVLPPGIQIHQGYLTLNPTVRVRIYGPESFLTVKGSGLVERDEWEYKIPIDDARSMLRLCTSQISKIRYRLVYGNHVWEVDEFQGKLRPLWLAEIEIQSIDDRIEIPGWVTDEVSNRQEYTNTSLSLTGRPPA